MSLETKEIEFIPGDDLTEAWVAIHNIANIELWGPDAQRSG